MKTNLRWGIWFACLLLAACGGSERQGGPSARIAPFEQTVGVTPFTRTLTLALQRYEDLASVSFTITPKPGTFSNPVHVTYDKTWLDRDGAYNASNGRLNILLFGLYANYRNEVNVTLSFRDGSEHSEGVAVETPPIYEKDSVYAKPNIKVARTAASSPGFDFVLIRNRLTAPVVIDTDGNVRWIGSGLNDSLSTNFAGDGFYVGNATQPILTRVELDGSTSSRRLASTKYTNFHHDLRAGKVGLLAELDVFEDGIPKIEQDLVEISPTGEILKEWNMAAIFRKAMIAGGDDPSNFVRESVDWFHMNSAIYSPADDSLIVSSRENFIVKLDYETGDIKWIFGDPGKHWYVDYPSLRALALKLTSGNPPVGQHSLSITSNGDLLLFNNGLMSVTQPPSTSAGKNLPYSAPTRYVIDETARTATQIWSYRHNPEMYSDVCSGVQEVTPGHFIVAYAMAYERTRAKLTAVDAAGNVAFDFEYPTSFCTTVFSAQAIPFERMELRSD